MTSALSNFERQKRIFDEFLENTQDRFNLIIRDDVNIVFDENFIQFDSLVLVRSTRLNLLPEIIFKESIKTPAEFEMVKNIFDNITEIYSLLREYMTLYSHMSTNFYDKGLSTDENYQICKENIADIMENNPDALNNKLLFITKNNEAEFRLSIDCFGSTKKTDVDVSYLVTEIATGESTNICNYKIDKIDFASDIAYQIANQVCSHIK